MRFQLHIFACGLALLSSTGASPLLNLFCDVVDDLVTVLHEQSQATAYCSSYLSIPLSTSSVTTTVTTATSTSVVTTTTGTTTTDAPPVTITTTTTVIIPITITDTETTTTTTGTSSVLATASITSCAGTPQTVAKRAKAQTPVPKPSCFLSYALGAPLSSACSCLSITPSTTTVTSTTNVIATVTSTFSTEATVTNTPTLTTTVTQTEQPLTTITLTTTSSVEATTTVGTTTLLAIPTFSIKPTGGNNNGFWFGYTTYGPITIDDDSSSPSSFSLSSNGSLIFDSSPYAGHIAVERTAENSADPYLVYLSNTGDLTSANSVPLSCSVSQNTDGTCPLSCVGSGGGTLNWDCNVYWRVGPTVPGGACKQFTPLVVGSA